MIDDGGRRDGSILPWHVRSVGDLRNVRLSAAWTWRLLEGLAVASALIWLLGTYGRQERAAGADGRQVAGYQVRAATAPVFSDARTLVPGAAAMTPTPAAKPVAVLPVPIPVTTVALATPAATATPRAADKRVEVAPLAGAPETVPALRPLKTSAIIPPPPPPAASAAMPERGSACPPPDIAIAPLAAGQMQVRVDSPCRRGQDIAFRYDGFEFKRPLPASGMGFFTIDLFAGDTSSVDLTFADETRRVLPVVARDLDRVSKVAIRWRAPVNLDLHVFEHAATAGQPGHVWANAPSSPEAALTSVETSGRGHGFFTALDDGQEDKSGDRLEVYTYVHGARDAGGSVAMALDHETRGSEPARETCGQGALAKVDYGVTMLSRKGEVVRAKGAFKPARCEQPLSPAERFDYALMPAIAVRN